MRGLLAVVFLLALGGAASAKDCAEALTQVEINQCSQEAFQKADAELNSKYREIVKRLDGAGGSELFREAQRAWLPFRDAECKFSASTYEGGSMQPMALSTCLEELTKKRIADFEKYLTCGEGECPVPGK
jgi:uncharacterized protein YecT (DUF1311 family)